MGADTPMGAGPQIRHAVVTGGAGFIGSHLCDRLRDGGAAVVGVDNFLTGSPENVAHLVGDPGFELVVADVSEPFDVEGPGPLVLARTYEMVVYQMKLLHVPGRRIVLARTEQGYVAFDDRCTHRGGPLADGVLICGTVQCPWHGSQFDTRTGAVKAGPAKDTIATYRVEVADGEVRLQPPGA